MCILLLKLSGHGEQLTESRSKVAYSYMLK